MAAPNEIVVFVEKFPCDREEYRIQQRAAKLAGDQERLQRQIDTLVYELYGLTDEEIKIVVGAS